MIKISKIRYCFNLFLIPKSGIQRTFSNKSNHNALVLVSKNSNKKELIYQKLSFKKIKNLLFDFHRKTYNNNMLFKGSIIGGLSGAAYYMNTDLNPGSSFLNDFFSETILFVILTCAGTSIGVLIGALIGYGWIILIPSIFIIGLKTYCVRYYGRNKIKKN
jgi:hypothetical protein